MYLDIAKIMVKYETNASAVQDKLGVARASKIRVAWQLPGTLVLVLPAGEPGLAISAISDSTGAQIDEIVWRNVSCLWHATELVLVGACFDEHRLSVSGRVTNVAMNTAILVGACYHEPRSIFCPSSQAAAILKCTRLFTRAPVSTSINCQSADVPGTAEMLQSVPQFSCGQASAV